VSIHGTTPAPRFREYLAARCTAEFGRAPEIRERFEGHDAAFVFVPDLTKQEAARLEAMLQEGMRDTALSRFDAERYAAAKADLAAVRDYQAKPSPTAAETADAVRHLVALVEALLGSPPADLRERVR
jgi:hypothetical protein